jgi:hypothetical protein
MSFQARIPLIWFFRTGDRNANQEMGKILGTSTFVMSRVVVTVLNGTYTSEVNSLLTTKDGDADA